MTDPKWPDLIPHLRWLGYTGLIPFGALALGTFLLPGSEGRSLCLELLRAYGVSIVSFVGAISWGIALVASGVDSPRRRRMLYWSVMPSLVGVASIAMPPAAGCITLAAVAAVALKVDFGQARALALPDEWLALRLHLSLGAIVSLLIGAYSAF